VHTLSRRLLPQCPAAVRPLLSFCLVRSSSYRAVEAACRRTVSSSGFHAGLVTVILFNICILAVEANGVQGMVAQFVFVANTLCTVVFSIELVMQVIAVNVPTFFSSNFNILDTLIVVISLVELSYG
jgi:hypothetical protein